MVGPRSVTAVNSGTKCVVLYKKSYDQCLLGQGKQGGLVHHVIILKMNAPKKRPVTGTFATSTENSSTYIMYLRKATESCQRSNVSFSNSVAVHEPPLGVAIPLWAT
jgi:hypothetical protein